MFNICKLVIGYFSKICFLRQISSGQANDLFNQILFPGVIRVAEERLSTQSSIDVLMIHIFFAVEKSSALLIFELFMNAITDKWTF